MTLEDKGQDELSLGRVHTGVSSSSDGSRIFSRQMKKDCWSGARPVPGRHPDRWRLDALGNVVSNKLTSCEGCLCHEYDHIVPWSKGGATSVSNCQILQTRVNRMKGNQDDDLQKMAGYSCDYSFSEANLDAVELALYGDVQRIGRHCRCPSLMEKWKDFAISNGWKSRRMASERVQSVPPCQNSVND